MPNACRVRKCKNDGSKRSLFSVPNNNPELFRKWQEALPGKSRLLKGDRICEKHFEKKYIKRTWSKCNDQGVTICEVQLSRPRLVEGAIPTIFDPESLKNDDYVISDEQENSNDSLNVIVDNDYSDIFKIIDEHGRSYDSSPKHGDHNYSGSINPIFAQSEVNGVSLVQNNKINEHEAAALQTHTVFLKCEVNEERLEQNEKISTCEPAESNASHCDVIKEKEVPQETVQEIKLDLSNIKENFSKAIPPSWSVTEVSYCNKTHLVFHSTMLIKQGNEVLPFVERSLLLDENGNVEYSVHSKRVNGLANGLSKLITSSEVKMCEVVKAFQRKKLCNGLNQVKDQHAALCDEAYKDGVGTWRHKSCPILSQKKCEDCKELRDWIIQEEKKSRSAWKMS